jgi:hypothetical protein
VIRKVSKISIAGSASSGLEDIFHCGVYCGVFRKNRGFRGYLGDMDIPESPIFTGGTG